MEIHGADIRSHLYYFFIHTRILLSLESCDNLIQLILGQYCFNPSHLPHTQPEHFLGCLSFISIVNIFAPTFYFNRSKDILTIFGVNYVYKQKICSHRWIGAFWDIGSATVLCVRSQNNILCTFHTGFSQDNT
jgi:hypothetical protein